MSSRKDNLFLTTDPNSSTPLYLQLYESIKNHILCGDFQEGDKIPSILSLSRQLEVSHATVERAYLQLSIEGYVQSAPRSGYRVNNLDLSFFEQTETPKNPPRLDTETDPFAREVQAGRQARYDFSFANLQPGSFPRKIWARLSTEVLREMTDEDLASYSLTGEPDRLQEQLAVHLRRYRGVSCDPRQIVFQCGTEAAITSIVQLLGVKGINAIAHEEPGYEVVTAIAKRFDIPMVSWCSDLTDEEFLAAMENAKPKLIFVTPSHQFPSGTIMKMDTRVKLLSWAQKHNAYIIEDDSCNEYRYDTQAVPSLQSLDKADRVIYLCNFSKALSPGLRLAYLVLPPRLLASWTRAFTFSWDPTPYYLKETLARFIERGYWDKQIRHMTTSNKCRHDALVEALNREFGDKLTLMGVNSGMHLFVQVHNDMTQEQLLASALAEGANVYGTKRYWHSHTAPENFVMIGFSAIALEDIAPGVAALRRAWF